MKKKVLLFLTLLIFFSACNNSSNLSNSGEQINQIKILHAGGQLNDYRLLNCQEAFIYYYDLGYRYFEYDLKLTKDDRIIATHSFEYLNVDPTSITYNEFKELKLTNGYTPVNEEWIFNTISNYEDVIFVIDSKMENTDLDAYLLTKLWNLQDIYNVDIKDNIIPEIFSKEMWEYVKDTTNYSKYFYSQYKSYYTVDMIIEYFSDKRIYGIAFSTFIDNDIKRNLYKLKENDKKLFMFTITNEEEYSLAYEYTFDGIYIDKELESFKY